MNNKQKLDGILALITPHKIETLSLKAPKVMGERLEFVLYIKINIPSAEFGKHLVKTLQRVYNGQISGQWSNGNRRNEEKEIEKDFPMDMINR